jgi:hypothetical protein
MFVDRSSVLEIQSQICAYFPIPSSISKSPKRDKQNIQLVVETLCLAILKDIPEVFNFYFGASIDRSRLYEPVGPKNLTILHAASIANNISIVERLIEDGMRLDLQDKEGWTALHFATFLNQLAVKEVLLSRMESPEASLTKLGASYKDLEWFLAAESDPMDRTNLVFRETVEEDFHEVSAGEFERITGRKHLKEMRIPFKEFFSTWKKSLRGRNADFTIKSAFIESYERFRQKRGPVIGIERINGVGLSLIARERIPKLTVISEYLGEFTKDSGDLSYGMSIGDFGDSTDYVCNANKYGSGAELVCDGFPNLAVIPFNNYKGFPVRTAFVSTEDIEPGDRLCYSYPARHIVKMQSYTELRPNGMNEFLSRDFTRASFNSLAMWGSETHRFSMNISNISEATKVHYLVTTPPILLRLIFEGRLKDTLLKLTSLYMSGEFGLRKKLASTIQDIESIFLQIKNIEQILRDYHDSLAKTFTDLVIYKIPRTQGTIAILLAKEAISIMDQLLVRLSESRIHRLDCILVIQKTLINLEKTLLKN